jgi:hypothetical protein
MFQLTPKRAPVAQPAAPVATTVVLHGLSPSMESLIADLPYVKSAQAYDLALETQQLDHSAQQAALDEVNDTLDKYDEDHPRTGPLHVYLLGNPSAANFDQDNETTPMKALVNAALRDKTNVVAALLPEDETVFKVADIPTSLTLRQLADTVLATESIPVLVGKAALESFLKDPTAGFKPAMEGALLLGALVGGVIAFSAWNSHRHNKKVGEYDKRKEEAQAAAKSLDQRLEETVLNSEWLAAHPPKGGTIDGAGIATVFGDLVRNPQALLARIAADGHAVTALAKHVEGTLGQFFKEGKAIQDKTMEIFGHNEDGQTAVQASRYLDDALNHVKPLHTRGTFALPVFASGAHLKPMSEWGHYCEIDDPHHANASTTETPALNAVQIKAATALFEEYLSQAKGWKLDEMVAEIGEGLGIYEHRPFDRGYMDVADEKIADRWYRTFGWADLDTREGQEKGWTEYTSQPGVMRDYALQYLTLFGKELRALAVWVERSLS